MPTALHSTCLLILLAVSGFRFPSRGVDIAHVAPTANGVRCVAPAFVPVLSADSLIGLWQYNNPDVGSGLLKNFRFYKDGRFEYGFGEMDHAARIPGLSGKYRLVADSVFLCITTRIEYVGGHLVGSSPYMIDEFALEGGKYIKVKQKPVWIEDPYVIEKHESDSGTFSIILSDNVYYKISSNPDTYKN